MRFSIKLGDSDVAPSTKSVQLSTHALSCSDDWSRRSFGARAFCDQTCGGEHLAVMDGPRLVARLEDVVGEVVEQVLELDIHGGL